MKIIQVTPGLLPIPPNGWGAVEKIIWEYHNQSIKLGHGSVIKYLDEVKPGEQTIVHVHVANLAILCHERGIPYIFTMHDHHAHLYGKDSPVYKENKKALRNALIGFVPAKYLVKYFGYPNIEYMSHGVNTSFFSCERDYTNTQHGLLCVANNGYIHDQSFDRKGFSFALQAAEKMNLPITICGPSNNRSFFEKYQCSYDKLTIKYDLTEDQLANEYKNHTIFIHASELEAGHPNLTVLEAMSSGLVVLSTLEDGQDTPGLIRITRELEDIEDKIKNSISDFENLSKRSRECAMELDWSNVTQKLISRYESISSETMKKSLVYNYSMTPISFREKKEPQNTFHYSFIESPKCEILGPVSKEYLVKFVDHDTNEVVYVSSIKNNCWAAASKKYFINWRIEVYDGEEIVDQHVFDATDKRVYIHIDSKALGDTIAWFPYVEEFRKKHNCKIVCSTFWNDLFKNSYSHFEFTPPGSTAHGLYAMYSVGWYYFENGSLDYDKNKRDIKKIPLQQTATDFLGLDFTEVRPMIDLPIERRHVAGDYACIAPHASSHAKYWNRKGGWQKLVNWFNDQKILPAMITHEPLGDDWHDSKLGGKLKNVVDRTGNFPIENRINEIIHSKIYIGLSSGLSWLSWALNKPTVVISGFTEEFLEPSSVIRIINKEVCHGCQTEFKLDAGDWEWCPRNKGTEDQFICTKEISSESVIDAIVKSGVLDI